MEFEFTKRIQRALSPDMFELVRESLELNCAHRIRIRSDRVSRIDELVDTHGDIELPYPQTVGLSLLANTPEHVTDDWRAACLEIQEVMATHGWVF